MCEAGLQTRRQAGLQTPAVQADTEWMAAPQTGPDARRTATHLTLALLGYFVLVTAVITLSPFDFSLRRFRIYVRLVPSDIVANIALFVPLGFLGRGLVSASARGGRVVWVAAACSLLIETAQIFIRRRYVSPIDVVSNSCGAWLGVVLRDWLERWALWHPRLVGRIGLDVPLVGLLYLLVPQLWLSSVGHDRGRAPQHDHAAARVCRAAWCWWRCTATGGRAACAWRPTWCRRWR